MAEPVHTPNDAPSEILPDVFVHEVQLPGYGVRCVVLRGRERTLLLDTLSRPQDMAALRPLLAQRPPVVVYSHADWDHVWGTDGLPLAPETIIAQDAAARRFDTDVPQTLERMRREEPGRYDTVRLIPPDTTFATNMTIDLGGLTVELHALAGHTADSLVAFVPERRLLLMGDTVETPFPCLDAHCPLAPWIRELHRWLADERVEHVVPAHGPMGGREIIAGTLIYLEALRDGRPFLLPEGLSPFYIETHAENLSIRQRTA